MSYQEDYDLKYGRKGLEWWEYQKGTSFTGPMFDAPGGYNWQFPLCNLEVKALFQLWTARRINASLHFIPRPVSAADDRAQKIWHEATARANALRKILGDEEANKLAFRTLDNIFDEGEGFPPAHHDYLALAYILEHGIESDVDECALESLCDEFGDNNPDTANLPGMAEYRRAHPGPSLWDRLRSFFRKMTAPRKSAAELIDADNPF